MKNNLITSFSEFVNENIRSHGDNFLVIKTIDPDGSAQDVYIVCSDGSHGVIVQDLDRTLLGAYYSFKLNPDDFDNEDDHFILDELIENDKKIKYINFQTKYKTVDSDVINMVIDKMYKSKTGIGKNIRTINVITKLAPIKEMIEWLRRNYVS